MNYPLISEYIESIKAAEENLDQLKYLCPVLDENGDPVMSSGNFAVVFKMKDMQTGKFHAVKCFLKKQEGRAEAYSQIAEELEYVSSTFLTPIKYLDKELFVDTKVSEETEFPVLLMDWVEGETLDKYICKHLDDQYELSLLTYQFSRLAMWLMPQPFAHGDLKPDNILVKKDGTLVLVDYDGMYVPAMKGQKARELGSPNFRHPGRTEEVFDDHIDDFSLASILLSLKAIALQPSLLEEYGASDRLLFSETDYRSLSDSKALAALQPLMQDAELASLYSLYILALSQNNLSQVSFRLFNMNRPQMSIRNICKRAKKDTRKETIENEYVDLGLSVKWATCNLGASKPEEFGDYFEWGCLSPQNENKEVRRNTNFDSKYNTADGKKVLCPEDDAATCLLGMPWRMPTLEEITELKEKCEWKESSLNGVQGCRVIGPNGNSIFLPLAGSYDWGRGIPRPYTSGYGAYWSSSSYIHNFVFDNSWYISIHRGKPDVNHYVRAMVYPIRPVMIEDDDLSTEVKEEDLINAWTDEYGVKYSADKKRLLSLSDDIELNDYYVRDDTLVICDYAFCNNKYIKFISLPQSVIKIGYAAFSGCEYLSVNIPDKVLTIGEDAFLGCSHLKYLHIPNSVEQIGDGAFAYCERLSSIVVDKDNKRYDSRNNCNAIIEKDRGVLISGSFNTVIPNGISKIGHYAFSGCSNLLSISLPNSIVEIGNNAFSGCSGLKSIYIPESIEIIGEDAFRDCGEITSIIVDKNNKKFDSRNSCNAIIDSTSNSFIFGCLNSVIPDDVEKLEDFAFSGCCGLKTIAISQGVQEIGNGVFDNCHNLESIDISESVKKIGKWAFRNCKNLTSINLPASLAEIGEFAFNKCEKLQSVIIPNGIDKISSWLFDGCSSLCTIEIPISIKEIGFAAFRGCINLTSVDIPDDVTVIRFHAFEGCSSLSSVVIPKKVTKIGECTFADCNRIESITIPDSVLCIGNGAFKNCTSLSSVFLSNNITRIEHQLFYGCKQLQSISIPPKVSEISSHAFAFSSIVSIFIPKSVSSINRMAFVGCYELESIVVEDNNSFYDSRNNCNAIIETKNNKLIKGCSKTVIPDTVITIGKSAFSDCFKLKSINIPYSIKTIEDYAFGITLKTLIINNDVIDIEKNALFRCKNIQAIYIPSGTRQRFEEMLPDYKDKLVETDGEENLGTEVTKEDLDNAWTDEYGVKYSKDKKRLLKASDNIKEYVIKDGTKVICNKAFKGCKKLTSVTIPFGVISIGESAFYLINQLESIIIPNSVTSIERLAFFGCSGLKNISLSEELRRIGDRAFFSCVSLKSIKIPQVVEEIGESVFQHCGLTSITVDTKNVTFDSRENCNAIIESSSNTLLYGCSKTIIPQGVVKIEDFAFWGIYKSIYIPDSIQYIGKSSFAFVSGIKSIQVGNNNHFYDSRYNCNAIIDTCSNTLLLGCSSTIIPESVKKIGKLSFGDKTDTPISINIPKGVREIDERAFYDCLSLESIIISDSVEKIGDEAFGYCQYLKKLRLSNNVTEISKGLFFSCIRLEEIDIPDSVTKIGISAFWGCSLQSVIIPSRVKEIGDYAFKGCDKLVSIIFLSKIDSIGKGAFQNCSSLKKIIIPKDCRDEFEELLLEFKELLMDNVSIDNHDGLRKLFTREELNAIYKAEVVQGPFTKLVRIEMNNGCTNYIPLVNYSELSIGDSVDMSKAKKITLNDEGIFFGNDGVYGEHVYKNFIEA